MINQSQSETIVIGYYPFRGNAQLSRLLCQYLKIPYKNMFLNPDQWDNYRKKQAKNWLIKDMPFLIDGDFVVTGPAGVLCYIVGISGRHDLFGTNLQDMIKIDSLRSKQDIRNAILGFTCDHKQLHLEGKNLAMVEKWQQKIIPLLNEYQKQAKGQGWFFGYISIMDFIIYQVFNQIDSLVPNQTMRFPKLKYIHSMLQQVPQIKAYQHSQRAIKQFSPVKYFNRYAQSQQRNRSTGPPTTYSSSSRRSNP